MDVSLSFAGSILVPLPCGALYWPDERTLLVADLHLEKASFYASRGRMLPPYDSTDTLAALIDAIETSGATRVVALGDSFHDAGGPDRLSLAARTTLSLLTRDLDWLWITGNHDHDSAATLGGRALVETRIAGIVLRHEAVPDDSGAEISGHFHPKVRVVTRGRDIVRRCFALTQTKLVLPAFGALTGGLDVADPAFAVALGRPLTALVATPDRLLRFPVAA
jgi:uncharacterized protein